MCLEKCLIPKHIFYSVQKMFETAFKDKLSDFT